MTDRELSELLGEPPMNLYAVHEVAPKADRTTSASCRSKWGGTHPYEGAYDWAGEIGLERVPLNAQGYSPGKYGRYFATGAPLFHAYDEESGGQDIDFHLRAADRAEARAEVARCYPHAKVRA